MRKKPKHSNTKQRVRTPLVGTAKVVYILVALLSYAALGVFYAYTSRIVSAIGASTAHAIVVAVACVVTVGLLMFLARKME